MTTPRNSQDSPLREAILDVARQHLPVREDVKGNVDSGGHIKKFFMEGVGWSEKAWTDQQKGSAGAAWCAAFASYCVRKGHDAVGRQLPVKLHAHGGELKSLLEKAGLYIPVAEATSPTGRKPRPGDFVVYKNNHIGLVESFDPATSKLTTIEGNTNNTGKEADDGVYNLAPRNLSNIQGFGITDPAP